jgi:hypothetical protein
MFAKDLTDARAHKIAPVCLRGLALEWHSHEPTSIEREFYTMSTMSQFCEALIARANVRGPLFLADRTFHDVRSTFWTYVTVPRLRFAKAAKVPTQMQLLTI